MGRKNVEEDVLWSDEREISRASVHKTPNGVVIPIEFQLPDDARETETIDAHEDISWRVDVAMGGTKDAADISGSYEIPVFGARDARLVERDLTMKEIEEKIREQNL